jgi:ribonuclease III
MPDFTKFEKKIGIHFNDPSLLEQAFTHRSYINENRTMRNAHNERLEFLGDAVLELVITNYLFHEFPDKPEGDLTSFRSAVVNTSSISTAGGELGMNDFLLLSRGERKDEGRARQYILANTFEAVIGAIYLDQGYDTARDFIGTNLFHRVHDIVEKELWQDAKSRFQELAQEKTSITPTYETLTEDGPDHDKSFTVGVFLNEEKVSEGTGKSKQEAEQEAAQKGLDAKGW